VPGPAPAPSRRASPADRMHEEGAGPHRHDAGAEVGAVAGAAVTTTATGPRRRGCVPSAADGPRSAAGHARDCGRRPPPVPRPSRGSASAGRRRRPDRRTHDVALVGEVSERDRAHVEERAAERTTARPPVPPLAPASPAAPPPPLPLRAPRSVGAPPPPPAPPGSRIPARRRRTLCGRRHRRSHRSLRSCRRRTRPDPPEPGPAARSKTRRGGCPGGRGRPRGHLPPHRRSRRTHRRPVAARPEASTDPLSPPLPPRPPKPPAPPHQHRRCRRRTRPPRTWPLLRGR